MRQVSSKIKSWWQNSPYRGKQQRMEWWGRVRVEGQTRFIVRSTLMCGLVMTASHDLVNGSIDMFTVFSSHLTGIILGYVVWCSNERDYKKALTSGQIPKRP